MCFWVLLDGDRNERNVPDFRIPRNSRSMPTKAQTGRQNSHSLSIIQLIPEESHRIQSLRLSYYCVPAKVQEKYLLLHISYIS